MFTQNLLRHKITFVFTQRESNLFWIKHNQLFPLQLTSKDPPLTREPCVLDCAEDGIVDSWLSRDAVSQPLKGIIAGVLDARGKGGKGQAWKSNMKPFDFVDRVRFLC